MWLVDWLLWDFVCVSWIRFEKHHSSYCCSLSSYAAIPRCSTSELFSPRRIISFSDCWMCQYYWARFLRRKIVPISTFEVWINLAHSMTQPSGASPRTIWCSPTWRRAHCRGRRRCFCFFGRRFRQLSPYYKCSDPQIRQPYQCRPCWDRSRMS